MTNPGPGAVEADAITTRPTMTNPGPGAVEADAITTRPTMRWKTRRIRLWTRRIRPQNPGFGI